MLAYAAGGGAGHVQRVLACICDLYHPDSQFTILASSPFVKVLQSVLPSNITIDYLPEPVQRSDKFHSLVPMADVILIDTFLYGPANELDLTILGSKAVYFLNRGMKSDLELDLMNELGRYPNIVVISPRLTDHYIISGSIFLPPLVITPSRWNRLGIILEVDDQPSLRKNSNTKSLVSVSVIHLGPQVELDYLLSVATELQSKIPCRIRVYSRASATYPGFLVLALADLLICGAGYNTLAEALVLRIPTLVFPFNRAIDDQFRRAVTYINQYPDQFFSSPDAYLYHRNEKRQRL